MSPAYAEIAECIWSKKYNHRKSTANTPANAIKKHYQEV
jgi:hypothetical protein